MDCVPCRFCRHVGCADGVPCARCVRSPFFCALACRCIAGAAPRERVPREQVPREGGCPVSLAFGRWQTGRLALDVLRLRWIVGWLWRLWLRCFL